MVLVEVGEHTAFKLFNRIELAPIAFVARNQTLGDFIDIPQVRQCPRCRLDHALCS